jgi:pimeloyl-ACP methyl ester carboxylesterase
MIGRRADARGVADGADIAGYRATEARLWASLGAQPRERRLGLARSHVEVRIQELGDGPPVLFVHGGSTSGTSWAELAATLPDRRCLLLDRPGTGLSAPLGRPVRTLDDLRDLSDQLVPDVLDALALGSADVVATSFGGWFALRAALAAPERIDRLVLFGWTAGAPVGQLPLALRLGVTPGIGDRIGRLPVTRAGVRAIFRGIGSGAAVDDGRISPEAIDAYAALLRWTPTLANDRALGRLFFSARGLDDRIVLTPGERASIATPIDWLWGGRDAFGGEAVARAFLEPFPHARFTILPEAGHAPWVDDLAAAAAFVRAALETSTAGAAVSR